MCHTRHESASTDEESTEIEQSADEPGSSRGPIQAVKGAVAAIWS